MIRVLIIYLMIGSFSWAEDPVPPPGSESPPKGSDGAQPQPPPGEAPLPTPKKRRIKIPTLERFFDSPNLKKLLELAGAAEKEKQKDEPFNKAIAKLSFEINQLTVKEKESGQPWTVTETSETEAKLRKIVTLLKEHDVLKKFIDPLKSNPGKTVLNWNKLRHAVCLLSGNSLDDLLQKKFDHISSGLFDSAPGPSSPKRESYLEDPMLEKVLTVWMTPAVLVAAGERPAPPRIPQVPKHSGSVAPPRTDFPKKGSGTKEEKTDDFSKDGCHLPEEEEDPSPVGPNPPATPTPTQPGGNIPPGVQPPGFDPNGQNFGGDPNGGFPFGDPQGGDDGGGGSGDDGGGPGGGGTPGGGSGGGGMPSIPQGSGQKGNYPTFNGNPKYNTMGQLPGMPAIPPLDLNGGFVPAIAAAIGALGAIKFDGSQFRESIGQIPAQLGQLLSAYTSSLPLYNPAPNRSLAAPAAPTASPPSAFDLFGADPNNPLRRTNGLNRAPVDAFRGQRGVTDLSPGNRIR